MKIAQIGEKIGLIGGITLFSLTIILVALGLVYLIVELIKLIF